MKHSSIRKPAGWLAVAGLAAAGALALFALNPSSSVSAAGLDDTQRLTPQVFNQEAPPDRRGGNDDCDRNGPPGRPGGNDDDCDRDRDDCDRDWDRNGSPSRGGNNDRCDRDDDRDDCDRDWDRNGSPSRGGNNDRCDRDDDRDNCDRDWGRNSDRDRDCDRDRHDRDRRDDCDRDRRDRDRYGKDCDRDRDRCDYDWDWNRSYDHYGRDYDRYHRDCGRDRDHATITIRKQAEGSTNASFSFRGDLGSFSLSDNGSRTFYVNTGTYTIWENVSSDWSLDSVNCVGNGQTTREGDGVRIRVSRNQNVTCTFENGGGPQPVKVVSPVVAPQPQIIYVPVPAPQPVARPVEVVVREPAPAPRPAAAPVAVLPRTGQGLGFQQEGNLALPLGVLAALSIAGFGYLAVRRVRDTE